MDYQILFNISIGVILGMGGFFFKILYSTMKALQENVTTLEKNIFKDFVQKDDYKQDINEMKRLLERIADKLESKMDKSELKHEH